MRKDLSNYYDDWTHVEVNLYKAAGQIQTTGVMFGYSELKMELDHWCESHIGIRSMKWDRYNKPNIQKRGTMSTLTDVYRFRREEDAVMFVLTHGGQVVDKSNKG